MEGAECYIVCDHLGIFVNKPNMCSKSALVKEIEKCVRLRPFCQGLWALAPDLDQYTVTLRSSTS